ncbi:MAG: aldolase/citrate lyase family protein [Solirubrobacteraceae bacterium]
MAEHVLPGAPASPGTALGTVWRRPAGLRLQQRVAWEDHERECGAARAALEQAAEELNALAASLPADEAEIVEAGALMAHDPALTSLVDQRVLAGGLPAADAILAATHELADSIAAIADETLAARADDVRSLGHRAARLTGEAGRETPPPDAVLIDRDIGPADVAELADRLAAVGVVGGGVTAHAAIVARSLGIPMVAGLPEASLQIARGTAVVLDGTNGLVVVEPDVQRADFAVTQMRGRREAAAAAAEQADEPALTRDGHRITVLVNAASAAELEAGLRAGAEGIGLLRTELPFLDAAEWPSERQHRDALMPILDRLPTDQSAVIRVLDIGPDKSPPFATGEAERGLALLLEHEAAFHAQLRAILACARDHQVRLLLPMVDSARQLRAARALLDEAGDSRAIPVGAMIETAAAVQDVQAIASEAGFLSIGTNDLTASVLGVDRFATTSAGAHDPRVLRAIADTVAAARDAGIPVEVCGEAASEELMVPLLIGLGVRELSVGAARVATVRSWIKQLELGDAQRRARIALGSAQRGHGGDQRVERGGGVAAFGPQS